MGAPVDIVDRGRTTVVEVERDTCDACGHQAFVFAQLADGRPLTYCAHHGTEYMDGLAAVAVSLIDMRHAVLACDS